MAVVDAFIFFNELDVLKIRMEELDPVVDWFVIVEGTKTFSGRDREATLGGDIPSWMHQYLGKTLWLNSMLSSDTDSWGREAEQRNDIQTALNLLPLNTADTIIISDADEIPRRSVIASLAGTDIPYSLWLRKFSYRLNIETDELHGSVKVMPYSYLLSSTPQDIRKTDIKPYVVDAGWEFSSLGTAAHISNKFKSFSHTELDIPGISDEESIIARMTNLEDVAGRGYKHKVVEIDDTWPVAVKDNKEEWKDLIWPTT